MLYEFIDTIISFHIHINIFKTILSIGLMEVVFSALILLYKIIHILLIDIFFTA